MTEQVNTENASVTRRNTRGAALAATKQQKFEQLFKGKRFEIVREVHLEGSEERFKTPLGNTGRNGFVLQEIGNESNRFIVGATALQKAADEYGAVKVPVREKKRRGRPAKVRTTEKTE